MFTSFNYDLRHNHLRDFYDKPGPYSFNSLLSFCNHLERLRRGRQNRTGMSARLTPRTAWSSMLSRLIHGLLGEISKRPKRFNLNAQLRVHTN